MKYLAQNTNQIAAVLCLSKDFMFFFPKQEYYWSFHLFLKKQETKANFPDSNSGNDLLKQCHVLL